MFGFEGRTLVLIVPVPAHCLFLFIYFVSESASYSVTAYACIGSKLRNYFIICYGKINFGVLTRHKKLNCFIKNMILDQHSKFRRKYYVGILY